MTKEQIKNKIEVLAKLHHQADEELLGFEIIYLYSPDNSAYFRRKKLGTWGWAKRVLTIRSGSGKDRNFKFSPKFAFGTSGHNHMK